MKNNIVYELTSDKFFYISKFIRLCLIVSNGYYFGEQKQIHDHSLTFQHLLKNYDQLRNDYYHFLDRISQQNLNITKVSEIITSETDSLDDRYGNNSKIKNHIQNQRKHDNKNKFDIKYKNGNNYENYNYHLSILESNINDFNNKNANTVKDYTDLRKDNSKSKSRSRSRSRLRSRSRSISNNKAPSVSNTVTNFDKEEKGSRYMNSIEEYGSMFREINNKNTKNIFLFECNIGGNSLKEFNFEITNQLSEKNFDILVLDNDKPYISSNIPVLYCLAKVIPIVSKKWLKDSSSKKILLNLENYIIKDSSANTKYKVSIVQIYRTYYQTGGCNIFQGYGFYIKDKISNETDLRFLIEAGKGVVLTAPPSNLWIDDEREKDRDRDNERVKSKSVKKSSSNDSNLKLVIVTKRFGEINEKEKNYGNIPKVTSEDIKTSILKREFIIN